MKCITVCKVYDTLYELGSMTVVLWTIIHVENQRIDLVSLFDLIPKGLKGIDDKVCRHLASCEEEVGIVMLGKKKTEKSKK